MTTAIHILLWVLACLVATPLWVLSAQCLLGLLPAKHRSKNNQDTPAPGATPGATPGTTPGTTPGAGVAVLVPAHNEEGVISATLDSLKRALPASGRIIVVADNCTDRTAQIARDHGATVVERHDTTNRGKGFALAAGLASLESDPLDIVIIVDADCTVTPTTLKDLASAAGSTGRPVQGVYLLTPPDKRDTKAVVSAFAFLVKNHARPRGMDLLGLPVPLTGSGMAFPYALLKDANLATGNIVEDLALGLELTERGHGPVLCDTARITGALPGADDAAVTQRTRWEHGYLSTLLTRSPALLIKGIFTLRPALVAAAVDLAVPPLSLLVMGSVAALGLTAVLGWFIGELGPACLLVLSLALTALSLVLVWARFGRSSLPISAALAIPGYILWKLPIYAKFLVGKEKTWVRTERTPGTPGAPASPGAPGPNGPNGSPGPAGTPGKGTSDG